MAQTPDDIFGEDTCWTWFVPEAWQQAASPDLFRGERRSPGTYKPPRETHHLGDHGLKIAYWAPLLHLTTFGLGWRFPELGFWRWEQAGRPVEDPILRTIQDRYGDEVELMMTWLAGGGGALLRANVLSEKDAWAPQDLPVDLHSRTEAVRLGRQYEENFGGGGDALHLIHHLHTALEHVAPGGEHFVTTRSAPTAHHQLLGNSYGTLFTELHRGGLPPTTDGRSTRVDLVCRPIGWLGTYRRSRTTGFWFRGRHRWHAFGH